MKVKICVFLMAAVVVMMMAAPLSASVTDDRIVSSARDTYIWKTYLDGDDIQIESKDGAVALTGTVAAAYHKLLAEETLQSLPGVKSVDNRLTLKGKSPTVTPDDMILDRVKTTLLFHRSTSAAKTDVSVQDGKVTLRGEASSRAQKELTTEYAIDIEGVKDVDNQMTVPSAQTTTEKVVENIDDASITVQIKLALLVHRSTGAIKTKVDTENGVVTLHGAAKNQAEKALVSKLVHDINGVKSVNNQMTIE
ncbi:MAG: BON domain-containing protein [Pseudomonadota bacterium]